jgi:hypothetical protein
MYYSRAGSTTLLIYMILLPPNHPIGYIPTHLIIAENHKDDQKQVRIAILVPGVDYTHPQIQSARLANRSIKTPLSWILP